MTRWLLPGVALSLLVWYAPGAVFMLAVIGLVGAVVHRCTPLDDRRFVTRLFWWGIGTRVVAATLAHFVAMYLEMGFPYLLYGQQSHDLFGDAAGVSLRAFWMARYWAGAVDLNGINLSQIFWDGDVLVRVYAAFYDVFGFSPLALKWIPCLFGALTGLVIFGVGRTLWPRSSTAAKTASLLAMFFPSTFLWSLSPLKEAPTVLLICLILWGGLRIQARQGGWKDLAAVVVWLSLLGGIRRILVAPMVTVLFVAGWFAWNARLRKKLSMTIVCAVASLMVAGWHVREAPQSFLRRHLQRLGNVLISTQSGLAIKEETASGYRIYPECIYTRTPSGQIPPDCVVTGRDWWNALFTGIAYFLFAPFPWSISSKLQVASYPEMMLWYALIPCWLRGVAVEVRDRPGPLMLIVSMLVVLVVLGGLSGANVGASFRHRSIVIPLLLLLSAIGLAGRQPTARHAP